MNNEIKAFLVNIKNNEDYKTIYDYITNLQEDYDRAMKLVDKGVENSYIKIKEQQKEIDKLTAESTEWENRTYYWQDKAEDLETKNKKAIEYINAGKTFDDIDVGKVVNKIQNNLLNILQESDK